MHLRRAALATTAVLSVALLAPVTTAQASTPLRVAYTCKIATIFTPDPFAMPVDATLTAVREGATVRLGLSMGKPVLPVDSEFEATLTSSLKATANGAATTLTGAGTVVLKPNTPVNLPVLKSSVTTTATSLAFIPGALTVKVATSDGAVAINCTPDAATSVAVPVTGPSVTPTPTVKQVPALTASLTKKVQKFKKAPVKVNVGLGRVTGTSANLQGHLVVQVGARTIAKKSVAGPKNFKITLPRNLKPGKYTVAVLFNAGKNSDYASTSRTVKIRVKR